MSFNRGMDTENVVYYTMEYYSAIENNDLMKLLGKWMKLESVILSEVTQSQKNMHCMHSLISEYKPKSSEYSYNSQTTDHMLIKKKEDQSVEISILLNTDHSHRFLVGIYKRTFELP